MGWNEQGKLTSVTVSQLSKANKLTKNEGHKYPDRDLSLGTDLTFFRKLQLLSVLPIKDMEGKWIKCGEELKGKGISLYEQR